MTDTPTVPPPLSWKQRAARSLRTPLYRRYSLAQLTLVIGYWVHSIAIGWLMWRLSASPWLLGLLAVCDLGPTFLLGPIAGTLSDGMNRRRLLIFTHAAFIVLLSILAFLTLAERTSVEIFIGVALLLGIVTAFDSPSRQAFVAELVGIDDLRIAIALNAMLFNAARLVGPAIGGALIAAYGEGWCFILKVFAHVPMLATLLVIKVDAPLGQVRGRFFQEMRKGFAFARDDRIVARTLIMVGICSFASVPYFSFLPALANQMLHADAGAAGMLMSVSGVGAMVAAFYLTVFDSLVVLRRCVVWSAFALGAAQFGMGFSGNLTITAILALPLGFAILSQNLASNSLLQHLAPPGYRGRVMAMYSMMMLGTVPLGSLVVGALGDLLGMPFTFIAGGLICSISAVIIALLPGWVESAAPPAADYTS